MKSTTLDYVQPVAGGRSMPVHVLIVDDQTGFPDGTAAANRIRLLASGLVRNNMIASVLITKPSEWVKTGRNPLVRGDCDGAAFEYTCGRTDRSSSLARRRLDAGRGWMMLLWHLWQRSRAPARTALYLYSETPSLCVPAALFAKLIGVRVLVEACEWQPALPWCSAARSAYVRYLRFRLCDGAVCISRFLDGAAREHGARRTLRLPVLVDPAEFTVPASTVTAEPYVFWCGQIDFCMDTVGQLAQAVSLARREHPGLQLLIAGDHGPTGPARVAEVAARNGMPSRSVRLLGYLGRKDLIRAAAGARALLVPLEADVRSAARFPTKIGEYLMTGRPVIIGNAGDISMYFRDGTDALLYSPGDVAALADRIAWVLRHPESAARIGNAGKKLAAREFDYAHNTAKLAAFIAGLL